MLSSRQPLIYFLSLLICLFWSFIENEISEYMVFHDWLLSLSVLFLRFIHAVACWEDGSNITEGVNLGHTLNPWNLTPSFVNKGIMFVMDCTQDFCLQINAIIYVYVRKYTPIITENLGLTDEAFVLSKTLKSVCPFIGGERISNYLILFSPSFTSALLYFLVFIFF